MASQVLPKFGATPVVKISNTAVRSAQDRQQALFTSERDRQLVDMRRRMTDRLYERRIAIYPELFAATAEFRRSAMEAAPNLGDHLSAAIGRIDKWHAGEGGLLLSPEGHQALMELRHAVKAITEQELTPDRLVAARTRVWNWKNWLREALRADIVLLFEESETLGSWPSGHRPPNGDAGMAARAPSI